MESPDQHEISNTSPFLRVPLEIRRLIYALVLPHTAAERRPDLRPTTRIARLGNLKELCGWGHVWHRGNTALIAVNRQIHDETASMLYGENTFELDVQFDKIIFDCRWRTKDGLTPGREIPWLEHFSQKNLLRVRRCVVTVRVADEYTGTIKYNTGGRGLLAGIRANVDKLAETMAAVRPCLRYIDIHLEDETRSYSADYEQRKSVLEPFRRLFDVREVKIDGVGEIYAEDLTTSMTASRKALLAGFSGLSYSEL